MPLGLGRPWLLPRTEDMAVSLYHLVKTPKRAVVNTHRRGRGGRRGKKRGKDKGGFTALHSAPSLRPPRPLGEFLQLVSPAVSTGAEGFLGKMRLFRKPR